MTSKLVCVSHSPMIMIRTKAPAEEAEILAYYDATAAAIGGFDPELVVAFGTDHFAGFFHALMPPYCIGSHAVAVNDVGGFAGDLQVPEQLAVELTDHLRASGFDPALSRRMKVDHAFSQPLHRLFGGVGTRPVVPVFIGAMSEPYLRFDRSRMLGEAVGRFVAASGKRVLFLGSGGLSHHPTRYYPLPGQANPEVAAWQLAGEGGGTMSEERWLQRLLEMHREGAVMLADGRRTAEDICLNADFDAWFIEQMVAGDLTEIDALDPADTVKRAGIGSLELHTWIAAFAAHRAAGGAAPDRWMYVPALTYGIGYGMLTAGLAGPA
jgi:2,3-dihydroxyphenylpropionate 1,2-dioxygenase